MAPTPYSLGAMVSFLETALAAFGLPQPASANLSRPALRRRRRELTELFEHLLESGRRPGSVACDPTVSTNSNIDTRWPIFLGHSDLHSGGVMSCLPAEVFDACSVDPYVAGYYAAPPFLGLARATQLDVAIRIGRDGATPVFESLMAYWERRHDMAPKASSIDKRPRHRRALDRLFLALMRFVFGFFGSHKVDARNNP